MLKPIIQYALLGEPKPSGGPLGRFYVTTSISLFARGSHTWTWFQFQCRVSHHIIVAANIGIMNLSTTIMLQIFFLQHLLRKAVTELMLKTQKPGGTPGYIRVTLFARVHFTNKSFNASLLFFAGKLLFYIIILNLLVLNYYMPNQCPIFIKC